MELKKFTQAFDPTRKVLADVDALVKQAGEHFNEVQQDQAAKLLKDFQDAIDKSADDAEEALENIEHDEQELANDDDDDEVDDVDEREPQDGDVYVVRNGKPMRVVEQKQGTLAAILGTVGGTAAASQEPVVVGQKDQRAGHDNPVTASAIASIDAHLEAVRVKTSKPSPGVTTQETGKVLDKPTAGAAVELATTEGDTQEHHTDDGSRSIQDAADSEAVKVLTPDVPTQQNSASPTGETPSAVAALQGPAGGTNQFTQSITADGPADEAAVEAGQQEVLRASDPTGTEGAVVDAVRVDPGPTSALLEHPVPTPQSVDPTAPGYIPQG